MLVEHHLQPRQVVRLRDRVVHETAAQQLTLRVVDDLFHEPGADGLGGAALELALDDRGVDGAAGIVQHDVAQQAHAARLDVHLDRADLPAERPRHGVGIEPRARVEPGLNACTWFYPDTVTWAFGGQVCAVEVDVETCRVRLLRHVVLHDPGRAINPAIVEGQLQGGAAQAIGAGLMEEVVYDAQGQLLSGSLMDYAIPKADDLPWLEVVLDEHPSIVDALADRGVVVRELPITPSRLYALLHRRV